MLGQGHGGIVARGHRHRLEQIVHRHKLPLLQVHLGAPHGGRVGGDLNGVGEAQTPLTDGLHDQQQGHDLGDTGGLQLVMGVLRAEDVSRLLFHQDPGGGVHCGGPGR